MGLKIPPLPPGLSMRDPGVLIATGFGSGRLSPAPGTWGTLAAWILGLLLMAGNGKPALILALLAAFIAGWWAVERFQAQSQSHDSGMIVIDEWIGIWIALLLVQPSWPLFVLAFFLFRAIDILKPWPIRWLDKNIAGAGGVILDDALAGLVTGLCVYIIGLWII